MTVAVFAVIGVGIVALLAASLVLGRRRRAGAGTDVPLQSWQITLPRGAHFPISQAAAWFAGTAPLLSGNGPFPMVEIRGHDQRLELRLSAPTSWEVQLRAQLAAWFPEARLVLLPPDATPVSTVEVPLTLEKGHVYALRVPEGDASDPLLGVFATLTAERELTGLRLTWRPAPTDWKAWAPVALAVAQQGRRLPPRGVLFWLTRIAALARATETGTSSAHVRALPGAEAKVRDMVFGAQLSVFAESDDLPAARARVAGICAQLQNGFRDPVGNALVPVSERGPNARSAKQIAPLLTLSSHEMAALFHLPAPEHTLIPRAPAREMAAPLLRTLPTTADITWLGEALTDEGAVPFGLGQAERRFHTYVIGKTGTGKSTFLAHVAEQDLTRGGGLGLIDPHGDLAEQVLQLVPPERHQDVLYFNAADADYPIAFNLFAHASIAERPLIASGIVGVFKKLYGDSWGPRLEYILRNTVLALLETPSPSLLALPRFLTDKTYRSRMLDYVRDPLLRSFFLDEYERYDPRFQTEAIAPILNKVGQFLASPVVRHIVGQSHSGFNLREVMDRGQVFIANLASGRVGEDNSDLLGGLLVVGFQLAAMSRANQPEAARRDFALLVDEFQHFSNPAFETILSEARKYRLSLTLSHQYLDQVDPGISEAVFGNIGTLVSFRVGAGDTARLAKEFAPVFDGQDLVYLPNHRFSCRLLQANGHTLTFSGRTVLPSSPRSDLPAVWDASRRRWARTRAAVELEIADAWEGRVE